MNWEAYFRAGKMVTAVTKIDVSVKGTSAFPSEGAPPSRSASTGIRSCPFPEKRMPHTAYIVEAVRTAGGRRNGKLSKWHPADLGAQVVDELVRRTKINGAQVDDVIFGCVSQIGAQSANLGRGVVLSSELLPESVPGTTVDRQCGSSQQAIHFAAQAVMSGTQDCVIAGGVEVSLLFGNHSIVTAIADVCTRS